MSISFVRVFTIFSCTVLLILSRKVASIISDNQQKRAMTKLKSYISSQPVLRSFDVSQPVLVSVDASPIGIGAVLMQEGQLVVFSSTTLTMTQKRYCQIEKELLVVQFGLQGCKGSSTSLSITEF